MHLDADCFSPWTPGEPVGTSPIFSFWFTSTIKRSCQSLPGRNLLTSFSAPVLQLPSEGWSPNHLSLIVNGDYIYESHRTIMKKEVVFKQVQKHSHGYTPRFIVQEASENAYLSVSPWKVFDCIISQLLSEILFLINLHLDTDSTSPLWVSLDKCLTTVSY